MLRGVEEMPVGRIGVSSHLIASRQLPSASWKVGKLTVVLSSGNRWA